MSTNRSRSKGGWWTKERQQRAYSVLRDKANLSDAGARGLISRWANVEAPHGPTSKNKKSGAFGILQGLGPRKPASADFEDQLNHVVAELNGKEKRAGDMLRNAKTFEEGAVGASAFERAEGYDKKTKRDNFVTKTLHGMAHVAAAIPEKANDILGSFFGNEPAKTKSESMAADTFDDSPFNSYDRTNLDPALGQVMSDFARTPSVSDIGINSGHRTRAGNLKAKGASKSQHLLGKALDLDTKGLSDEKKARALDRALLSGAKGIGVYPSGALHIDTRETPTAWGPNGYKSSPISSFPGWARPMLSDMMDGGVYTPHYDAPIPTARPETAIASVGAPKGGFGSIFSTAAQAGQPAAADLTANPTDAAALAKAYAEAGNRHATPAAPARGALGIASEKASRSMAALQQPTTETGYRVPGMQASAGSLPDPRGVQVASAGDMGMIGSSMASDFAPSKSSITGLMSRAYTGSTEGLGSFAPRDTTGDRVKGGLRIGGQMPIGPEEKQQPIGAEATVTGTAPASTFPGREAPVAPNTAGLRAPQTTASIDPGLMGGATQTALAQPGVGAMPGMEAAFTPAQPAAVPPLTVQPEIEDRPVYQPPVQQQKHVQKRVVPAPAVKIAKAPAPTVVSGLSRLRDAVRSTFDMSGAPPAMDKFSVGGGLAGMAAAMGGARGATATNSTPGVSYSSLGPNQGGIRTSQYGWQVVGPDGSTSGGLHSNKEKSGGFFSGLRSALGLDKDKDGGSSGRSSGGRSTGKSSGWGGGGAGGWGGGGGGYNR
jgi:hypothetical protein